MFIITVAFLHLIINDAKCFIKQPNKLNTLVEWRHLDYFWPSPGMQQFYVKYRRFNYTTLTPIDLHFAQDGRLFVTVMGDNVPASVNIVSKNQSKYGPLLQPYPNWDWHANPDCNIGIKTAYRIQIDRCNQLWILDTGTLNREPVCSAKFLIFDLATDKLLRKLIIPNEVARNPVTGRTLLNMPTIEYDKSDQYCRKPRIYMADPIGLGMVIIDSRSGKFYRIDDPAFEPNNQSTRASIDGVEFTLSDGLFGLAVSPQIQNDSNNRVLMFRPYGSMSMYATTIGQAIAAGQGQKFQYYSQDNVFPSQVTAMTFSENGILFFGMTREIAVGCWNPTVPKPLTEIMDIAVQDSQRLEFISAIKILRAQDGKEKLLMMSNRLQRVMNGTMDYENEINFRITMADVLMAMAGKKCSITP